MTKRVLLSISGLQYLEGEKNEPMEVLTMADYYQRNGTHYLLYEEPVEGTSEVIRNTLKIKKDCVEVQKKGPIQVRMVFEQWKKQMTQYETPFGSIPIGIQAGKVDITESEYDIHVELNYVLELNEEYLADSSVILHVKSKDAPDFSFV
ncbi:MAG: DUF1934 domain-containing protein [Lachnospiraceae bacterium]|nr:DUF1934 domain-containing protein [Lachnospiraceae bacterium]